jgi:hypothetical protein
VGLRRPLREGALVAVYAGRALLPVRLSYRIEWNFPRTLSDAVRDLKQRPAARRPRRSASPLFAAGERARIAKRLTSGTWVLDPKGNVTSWNTGADKGL